MKTKCQKFYFVYIFFFKVSTKTTSKVKLMYTLNALRKKNSKCVIFSKCVATAHLHNYKVSGNLFSGFRGVALTSKTGLTD